MYIPVSKKEFELFGWEKPDIILITGDAYIDSPNIGIAVIGKILLNAGFKVGIIPQPDTNTDEITKLGEPSLFWGVTSGCMDSMVSNYTASKKRRNKDDLTPGGLNIKRPDRAVIAYTNLIRKYFKNTRPIILGGLEASLRRTAHYDFWDNKIRRSVLFDAKADYLVYGMGEKTIIEVAENLKNQKTLHNIRGLCYASKEPVKEHLMLPSYEEIIKDKHLYLKMFKIFYENTDPLNARGLMQKQDTRYLIQNPPQSPITQYELDNIYQLSFERNAHPVYENMGSIKALDTIRFSVTSHRGCYGQCNFCAITAHQGRSVTSRTEESIMTEIKTIAKLPGFKGIIQNIGGPTANMYGSECSLWRTKGACKNKRCIFPSKCGSLKLKHDKQIQLLKSVRQIKGIKKVFISSGIRYDLILADIQNGENYLKEIINHHISGQLKIAPEHISKNVLKLMGKPDISGLKSFIEKFNSENKRIGKKQYLTYYFIAAHPGCTDKDMKELKLYTSKYLKLNPEQVQIFTPTPSTLSGLMYFLEIDPDSGKNIFVEKDLKGRENQKDIIIRR